MQKNPYKGIEMRMMVGQDLATAREKSVGPYSSCYLSPMATIPCLAKSLKTAILSIISVKPTQILKGGKIQVHSNPRSLKL